MTKSLPHYTYTIRIKNYSRSLRNHSMYSMYCIKYSIGGTFEWQVNQAYVFHCSHSSVPLAIVSHQFPISCLQ